MRVLVACEESQEVCKAFRALGHEAYSCDIQEPSGGHPEWHILGDVRKVLEGYPYCPIRFSTMDGVKHEDIWDWDIVIAHPPCTDLAVSGARWFAEKRADGRQQAAIDFFMLFTFIGPWTKVAIENPVGIMSTHFQKPDQIIQPWQFRHHAREKTCLWLFGLPPLKPTNIVDEGEIFKGGFSVGASLNYAMDENGKIIPWNDPRTAKARSKTFPGIARAMAEQWGGDVRGGDNDDQS